MCRAHAEIIDAKTRLRFADGEVAFEAHVVTDRDAGYSAKRFDEGEHPALAQTMSERREQDDAHHRHWTASALKR